MTSIARIGMGAALIGNALGVGACGGDDAPAGVPPEPQGAPLLERPITDGYHCAISEPFAKLELPWDGGRLLGGASPSLFWKEQETGSVLGAEFEDGVVGTPFSLRDATNGGVGWPAVARNGDLVTVVWTEFQYTEPDITYALMSAQVNSSGQVITPAHALSGTANSPGTVAIAAFGDGYGVAWSELSQDSSRLMFARMDAGGDLVGAPEVLSEAPTIIVDGLVALDDGFGVAFRNWGEKQYPMRYLGLDAEGKPYRAPVPFSDSSVALIRRGDRVLAAWEHSSGKGNSRAVNLRVGWFDDRGSPVGKTYDLQAPVPDQENVSPAWVELRDDLGLVWSRGSIIYICAGCIPDNHLEFVVLDGETLQPKSEVVTIENSATIGGLLGSTLASDGSDVTVVTSVTYHTNAEGASATITCTP
jgi:hypothetical protein